MFYKSLRKGQLNRMADLSANKAHNITHTVIEVNTKYGIQQNVHNAYE